MFSERTTLQRLLLLKALSGGGQSLVERTALGNPLTFGTDVSKPLKSLLIPFTPQQSGTGDPSPSNIRSIIPWDGLSVWNGGKNLFNKDVEPYKTGMFIADINNNIASYTENANYNVYRIPVKQNTYYTFGLIKATDPRWAMLNEQGYVVNNGKNEGGQAGTYKTVLTTATTKFLLLSVAVNGTYKCDDILQLEEGETHTEYEPITDTDISFPSPVYGGTLDVVSGVLGNGWIPFVFDDQTVFNTGVYDTTRDLIGAQIKELPSTSQDVWVDAYCDKLVRRTSANEEYSFVIAGNGQKYCQIFCGRLSDHPEITTKDEAKAFVSNWLQNNPVTLVYSIPTPTEQTLTGHQITALIGNNTIWSDADGSMTCVYLVSSKYAEEHPVGGLGSGLLGSGLLGSGTEDNPEDPIEDPADDPEEEIPDNTEEGSEPDD